MFDDREIEDLRKAIIKRRFKYAKEICAKIIQREKKPPELFKYIGLLSLIEKDYNHANENLKRAHRLLPKDTEVLNALGFIALKTGKIEESLDFWLQVLSISPSNKTASFFLKKIKNAKDTENLPSLISVRHVLPTSSILSVTKYIPSLKIIIIVLSAFLLVLLFIGISIKFLPSLSSVVRRDKNKINELHMPLSGTFIIQNSDARFRYTESELNQLFKRTKHKVKQKDHNEVIITVNKILLSNADDRIKELFVTLRDYLPEPKNSSEIKTKIPIKELFNYPEIYEGAYLVGDGSVSQLKVQDDSTLFLLKIPELPMEESYTWQVRAKGHYDGLKNGSLIRVLGRFKSVVPLKGQIIVESVKLWFQKTEFLEAPVGRR